MSGRMIEVQGTMESPEKSRNGDGAVPDVQVRRKRHDRRFTMTTITRWIRRNGVDPKKFAHKIGGNNNGKYRFAAVKPQITRKDVKKMKRLIADGQVVCLRPLTSKPGRFEFVNPNFVTIKATRGGVRIKRSTIQP